MLRNGLGSRRKSVKNPGILGLEDAGDLATHNATIARDHRNRIFNIAFLGFQMTKLAIMYGSYG
jgi:hypothetical protein